MIEQKRLPASFDLSFYDLAVLAEILNEARYDFQRDAVAEQARESLSHLISETARNLRERERP